MRALFVDQKARITKELMKKAKSIFQTNIPQPYSTLLWAYFFSRSLKLFEQNIPLMVQHNSVKTLKYNHRQQTRSLNTKDRITAAF